MIFDSSPRRSNRWFCLVQRTAAVCAVFAVCANLDEVDGAHCSTNGKGIYLSDTGIQTGIDHARIAYIQRELDHLGLSVNSGQVCAIKLRLDTIPHDLEDSSLSAQGFEITRDAHEVRVASPSSLGLIYGFYEILDQLGVRFFAPALTVKPAQIDPAAIRDRRIVNPAIAQRGFWVFGEERAADFLLWAGRNRFNLVGGHFAGGDEYRRIFGIARWNGGHDVIARLTPTDRPVRGVMLAERH
ncbi:MAG: hypothetical protein ACRCYS_07450, partial [Beijerinckiaceae bacterium]